MFLEKNEPQQLFNDKAEGEFSAIRRKILQVQNNWSTFYEQLSQLNTPYTEEFQQHNQNFSRAVDKILTALETPTLTLATTGTTSSGKSTLVNLLCGAEIMPSAVQEMSAGIVTIKHANNGKRLLKIEQTTDAKWDCGEWHELSDGDIFKRLNETMKKFNDAKNEHDFPSPVIELTYPIACFFPNAGMLDLRDLPQQTQFQIMDLPGKRNQNDKINSAVIQNCRRALSIVTYNMAETDETARHSLVEDVLEQVKLMGGSPARMLFALNRIDVFRKNKDWPDSEHEQVEKTVKEIKQTLHDHLPEHRNILENFSYGTLSGESALRAWQIKTTQGEQRIIAAEQVDDHFKSLIPRHIKENLSGGISKWTEHDFQQVQNAVWDNSYAKDFFPILEKHIRENFAKLIIAPLLIEFEGAISEIIGKASRICTIEIKSIDKQHCEVNAELDASFGEIKGELKRYHKDLLEFPEFIENSKNPFEDLLQGDDYALFPEDSIYSLGKVRDLLRGFSNATSEPLKWPADVSESATTSFKSGRISSTGTKVDNLSPHHHNRFKAICTNLMKTGYTTELAKKGGKIEAAWDGEKESLEKLLKAISNYSSEISQLMQDVYEERVARENIRIKELAEEITQVFLSKLNDFVQSLDLKLNINFNKTILDGVNLEIPKVLEFDINVSSQIQIERNPWLLWLSKRDVYHADIPAADYLHQMIIGYLGKVRESASEPLVEAILKYYKEIDYKTHIYINSIKDDMKAKLETAYQRNHEKHQQQKERWEGLNSLANKLYSDMTKITALKG